MTRGHKIVADGWAGASNHYTPQTPLHTQTYKVSKTVIFPLFDSITSTDQRTDGWTNGQTDIAPYRVVCPPLKTKDLICQLPSPLIFYFPIITKPLPSHFSALTKFLRFTHFQLNTFSFRFFTIYPTQHDPPSSTHIKVLTVPLIAYPSPLPSSLTFQSLLL